MVLVLEKFVEQAIELLFPRTKEDTAPQTLKLDNAKYTLTSVFPRQETLQDSSK